MEVGELKLELLELIVDLKELGLVVLLELEMVLVEGIGFGLIEHEGFDDGSEISLEFVLKQ